LPSCEKALKLLCLSPLIFNRLIPAFGALAGLAGAVGIKINIVFPGDGRFIASVAGLVVSALKHFDGAVANLYR